jgi:hypothetical protein
MWCITGCRALLPLTALLLWSCGDNNSSGKVSADFYFEYAAVSGPDETPSRLTIRGSQAELLRQWAVADTGMQTIGFFRATLGEGDLEELLKAFPKEAEALEMRPDEPYFLFLLKVAGRHDSLRVPRRPEALEPVSGLVTAVERLEAELLARPHRTLALQIQPVQNLGAGVPIRLYNAGVEPVTVILNDSTLWVERADLPPPVGDSDVTPLPIVWEHVGSYSSADTVTVPAGGASDVMAYLNRDSKGDFLLRARFRRPLMPGAGPTEISGSIASKPIPCSIPGDSNPR